MLSSALLAGCAPTTGTPTTPVSGDRIAHTHAPGTPPVAEPRASLAPRDVAALKELSPAASGSAAVDGTVSGVDCWTPSQHLVKGSEHLGIFSVLCRVHYVQDGTPRYKDMTCIGNFFATPMLTHCYRWAYYSAEPRFEDGARLASPPPTPFPTPPRLPAPTAR